MKNFSIIWLIAILLHSSLLSVEKIRVYEEKNAQNLLLQTSDYQEISNILHTIGIRFEKWQTNNLLSPDLDSDAILEAYKEDIQRLMKEEGYQTVDIVRIFPHSPNICELRNKFLAEHIHSEDEVRFFVEGSGLFYLHFMDNVYVVLCEKGDLISIPKGTPHWFDMGPTPHFTAIRFFNETEGWIAHFTNSKIAQSYPLYE